LDLTWHHMVRARGDAPVSCQHRRFAGCTALHREDYTNTSSRRNRKRFLASVRELTLLAAGIEYFMAMVIAYIWPPGSVQTLAP
jgi:hypothetical protein